MSAESHAREATEILLGQGWVKDEYGKWFNPSSLERTDFAGAYMRALETHVDAEARRTAGG